MDISRLLKQNPLLRLVLPFVVGIAVEWNCHVELQHMILVVAVSLSALLLGFFRFSPKWLFGLGAVTFMFAAGVFVEHCQNVRMSSAWSLEKQVYVARLQEVPSVRGTNVKALASVSLAGDGGSDVRKEGSVYIYFQRTPKSDLLEIGDSVCFEAVVRPPKNAGNPAEFDFENYCRVKGITGSVFLYDDDWQKLASSSSTLPMRALEFRDGIVAEYERWGFDEDGLALLSALTVGEKRDLTQELKENYASAGASHVLALSGLHLGILYALLSVVLPLRRRNRLSVVLREAVVLSAIWCFAFMAGLTPSVVRAAVLFSLVSLGRCIGQDSSSLSSLAFAAMAMLLLSPHSLFDIGFQLSYAAVFAILVFAEPLQNLLQVGKHGAVYGYVANLFILSFAAQVGTMPIVWYHFGELPLYSLFTNLLVVPMAFVAIALAIIALLLSFIPFLQQPFIVLLGLVVDAMNGFVSFAAELPGATISLPSIGVVGALFVCVVLVVSLVGVLRRRWWLVALPFLSSLLLLPLSAMLKEDSAAKGERIIIYNNRKNPLLHAVQGDGRNWLVSTVPQLDAEYEYVSSPYVKREGLLSPEWACWNHTADALSLDEGLLDFCGLKVRLVDNSYWNENLYSVPADVVVLCRGFLGSVEELLEVYPTDCLVLDASLYSRSRERILRECTALGIEPVDISRTGAVALLPGTGSFTLQVLSGK